MGVIISLVTSIYSTILARGGQLLTSVTVKVVGLVAKLGLKLISVNWIKKVVDISKKIGSILKKTVLNPKFVALVKYLIALALCVITVVQVIMVAGGLFRSLGELKNAFNPFDAKPLVGFVITVTGLICTLLYCVKFLLNITKKKIKLNFITILLFTYVSLLCCYAFAPNSLTGILLKNFTLVNILALVTVGYAFVMLFDSKSSTSFFGVLLASGALLTVFLLFKNNNFAMFLNFEITEIGYSDIMAFDIKNLNFIKFIQAIGDPYMATGVERPIIMWCNSFSSHGGVFVVSLVKTITLFIIFACNLMPYLFLSLATGLLVGLINDRITQYVYLNRVLYALKYLFIYVVITAILSIILAFAFKFKGALIIANLNVSALVLTLCMALLVIILTALSKKLIMDKPYMKFKHIKLK